MSLTYSQYTVTDGLRKLKTRTAAIISAATLVLASGVGLALTNLNAANAATPEWNVNGTYTLAFELGGTYVHDAVISGQNGAGDFAISGGYPAGGPQTFAWEGTGNVTSDVVTMSVNYTAGAVGTHMEMEGTVDTAGVMSGTWSDDYNGGTRNGTWSALTGVAQPVADNTVVVSGDTAAGENQPGWLFNRDASTSTPYEFNSSAASIGTGSLYVKPIGANASDKFVGENFVNAKVADVESISYDFKIGSGGEVADSNQFYMNVYANFGESDDLKFYDCRYNVVPTVGSVSGFTTVTFDPTQAYPVTQSGSRPAGTTCPAVPADMDNFGAGSNIRMFALNLGDSSTSDVGLDGFFDKVVVSTVNGVTTYDFEPATPKTKDDCKNGMWATYNSPAFKNQGQCIASVESASSSKHNR